jgi:deoxyribodipyrimidine photo-lyase
MHRVPAVRIRDCNDAPVRASRYVLYWMIATRRLTFNFALDRALEALRCGYRWASDRMHRFVIEGMADNAVSCERAGVRYFPYVEPTPGAGSGLLEALARHACVVVADDYPCFFLPRMVAAAAKKLPVRMEAVDSNGMLPLRAASQVFSTAYAFRRFLQRTLPTQLAEFPNASPFSRLDLPEAPLIAKVVASRWSAADASLLSGKIDLHESLPIDHAVVPTAIRGGHSIARKRMKEFLEAGLLDYGEKRNQPELHVASSLSPYLDFGHISVHEIFREVVQREKWEIEKLSVRTDGSRAGWWNMSANAESFLDELITWREVGYNFSSQAEVYDQYESLPAWALKTLRQHAGDEREHVYSLEEFEAAKTYDRLWNATQTQLVREGRIHNYLRMLWGKKILEWSRSPQGAVDVLIHLNNKYGLDGRDPNSYSGIFWCLGRYDRPWGPERPIYGQVRYMSSEARKVSVKSYLRKYASGGQTQLSF